MEAAFRHAFFLLLLTSLTAFAADAWKEFTAPDGSFSILMPGEPTESKLTQKTAVGSTQVTRYVIELQEGGQSHTALGVSVSAYPVATVGDEHTQTLLDSARDGAVKIFAGGQLRGERDFELNGVKAKEIILERGETVARMRYFWVAPRLYQIQAITSPEMETKLAAELENFFTSFKLNSPVSPP
jgi:hypothetical protein